MDKKINRDLANWLFSLANDTKGTAKKCSSSPPLRNGSWMHDCSFTLSLVSFASRNDQLARTPLVFVSFGGHDIRKLKAKAKVVQAKAKAMAVKQLAVAKKKFIVAEKQVRSAINKNPEKAVVIAAAVGAAIGFALARVLRRRK